MSKKIKIIIAAGGTGGHVLPGYNLGNHLKELNYDVNLVTDKRGIKFLSNLNKINIFLLPSSPLIKKNIFMTFFSLLFIIYSILRSLIFLVFKRPSIILGMGGYASLPICIACAILRIKFIIYENNLIIGKANKYLLPFAEKLFVAYKELEGIPKKFDSKTVEVGNIVKKEIIELFKDNSQNQNTSDKLTLLVLGGSQAAKVFAEILPNIFKECKNKGIPLKILQQCLPNQNEELSLFYKNENIDFETFNFSNNLQSYFSKANLAITRSGSSMLAELTNCNLPFIAIPLPSSADNHQFKNATFYKNKDFAFIIEEKDLENKLLSLIEKIYKNKSLLIEIKNNQRQYSDKNVYNNVSTILKDIINEKN